MLCYRCGSHVPDSSESCPSCGQKLAGGGVRQATGTFSRRRALTGVIEGSPYRAGDIVGGRYQIRDVVGSGPLAFVFRAHDREIDVEVALKAVNPRLVQTADERKAFAKHIRQARKLSHPNLVRVYEEGEDQDRPFYTMQFLDGLTLRKIIDLRLQKGQFFALPEIEPIFAQVAAALDGAHKVGPHSDLKPENVLVLPDLLKVTDFGLGLAMPRLPFVQAVKSRRADRYLAPEIVEGREVDARADLYSMAVILGEMLAGLTPDGSVPELQRRNPDVPPAVEGLYRKALSQNPNVRPRSAPEMFAELQEAARKAAPPSMRSRPEPAMSAPPPMRPRAQTGVSLAMRPRQSTDLPPPPPPPVSEEVSLSSVPPVDATQPVDEAKLKSILNGGPYASGPLPGAPVNGNHGPGRNGKKPLAHDETEVIQSAQYLQPTNDDDVETKAKAEVVSDPEAQVELAPPPPPPRRPQGEPKSRTALWLVLLTVLGVGVGAAGGWQLLQRMKPTAPVTDEGLEREARRLAEQRAAEEKARRDAELKAQAEVQAEAQALADQKAKDEKVAIEKLAAERLAAEKESADRAAQEKAQARAAMALAAAERAEKAAADKKKVEVAAVSPGAGTPEKNPAGAGPCDEGMKLVPAGAFKFGTPRSDDLMAYEEKNQTTVEGKAFCIDLFEFPNKRGVAPTVNVAWADARRLCEGKGKRLCSEEEWEKACRGPGSARFPYGNGYDANACNTEDESETDRVVAPSGRFSRCRSGFGVADLSGNVAEWTADKVLKGGSFAQPDFASRCSARKVTGAGKAPEVGFRCCADSK